MEVRVIRGYKLKLWKDRLNLDPDFVDIIDPRGINYVHLEQPLDEMNQVVLLTHLKDGQMIPVLMMISKEHAEALIERIDLSV